MLPVRMRSTRSEKLGPSWEERFLARSKSLWERPTSQATFSACVIFSRKRFSCSCPSDQCRQDSSRRSRNGNSTRQASRCWPMLRRTTQISALSAIALWVSRPHCTIHRIEKSPPTRRLLQHTKRSTGSQNFRASRHSLRQTRSEEHTSELQSPD